MTRAWRGSAKRLLERAGLLPAAYWVSEQRRVWALRRRPPDQDLRALLDGLPVPPPRLIVAVGGDTNVAAYLHGGQAIARAIDQTLKRTGVNIASCRSVLDFGCGSGRVIRRWRHLAPGVDLHGTDYNPALVAWCRTNLPFATFNVNGLEPPLNYVDAQFDLIYAFSVFTHFPAELATRWMHELRRVVSPGGHVLLSVHGTDAAAELTPEERARFDAGELVVRYESVAGSNLCAAFHPEQYLRTTLARGWEFVDYSRTALGQDFVILKKPLS